MRRLLPSPAASGEGLITGFGRSIVSDFVYQLDPIWYIVAPRAGRFDAYGQRHTNRGNTYAEASWLPRTGSRDNGSEHPENCSGAADRRTQRMR